MAKYKLVTRLIKNTAIGGAAGYLAAGSTAGAHGRNIASQEGAMIGAVVGSASALPLGKLLKSSYSLGKVVGRGLKATPGSKIGGAMRGFEKASYNAGVTFRRIRGRIVPVRKK